MAGVARSKDLREILKRASKTAEIVYNGEIVFDKRLMERYNGEMDGKVRNACV
jgi:uncharacterized protein with ATP-grasp and redox domains